MDIIFNTIKKVSVNPLFFVILAFFVIMDGTLFMVLILSAALIHEGAHILSFVLFKAEIKELRFQPFGIQIILSKDINLGYIKETVCALAGPFVNLALALILVIFGVIFDVPQGYGFFLVCNIALFALNIMPIMPLDGGRALHALLLKKTDIMKAERISFIVSIVLTIPLLALGIYILKVTEYNFSLILISFYLLIRLYKKYRYLSE